MREEVIVHDCLERIDFRSGDFFELRRDCVPDPHRFQGTDDVRIRALQQRIGIPADGVGQDQRLLSQAVESCAEQRRRYVGNILPVDQNAPRVHPDYTEKRYKEGALPTKVNALI